MLYEKKQKYLRMLLFGLALADYIKLANQDLYLGAEGSVLKLVEKPLAINFERRMISRSKKYLTALIAPNNQMVGFDYDNNGKLEPYNESRTENAFEITLDTNGKFLFITNSKCLYPNGNDLKRGNCSIDREFAYFEIVKGFASEDTRRQEIIKAGNKLDKFNPVDPLALENDQKNVRPEELDRILLPYRERLSGARMMDLPDPDKTKRVLVKFNVF